MNQKPPPIKRKVDIIAVMAGCGALGMGFLCVAISFGLYWVVQSYQEQIQSVDTPVTPIIILATPQTTQQAIAMQDPATPEPVAPLATTTEVATVVPAPTILPTETPTSVPPTAVVAPSPTPLPIDVPFSIMQNPVSARSRVDLDRMWAADFDPYDYYDVALRMEYADVGNRTITRDPFAVGDRFDFILDDRIIPATLQIATSNAYLWIEDGVAYDVNALQEVAGRLENELYPRLTEIFGREWSPGVDNDPHFSILHFSDNGDYSELGFFDSLNEYPQSVDESSNEQEMLFMNMSQLDLGDELYYGTLVHELQHLIQWNLDHNETVWLDEGLAQLSELYAGFQTADSVDYLADTSLQLNSWSYEGDLIYAHYGASYLFITYFWEQLGNDAIRDLTASPTNGFASMREVIAKYRPNITLEQLLSDWAIANLLDNAEINPKYGYQSFSVGLPTMKETMRSAPFTVENELPQYGVHYLSLTQPGSYTLSFAGDTLAEMVPTDTIEGTRMWLAPAINDASMRLTHPFDLRGADKATLLYTVWYELEQDFDYGYVQISADNGRTWDVLTPENDSLGYYGPAFTGSSADIAGHNSGWVEEAILLDDYVGREVLLRFEVLTDSAVSGFGFALDDISIPEIDFYDGAEQDNLGAWIAEGFVATGPQLPQQWSVHLVEDNLAKPIPLNNLNQTQAPITVGPAGATLVVMPQTPYVNVPAYYWLNIESRE